MPAAFASTADLAGWLKTTRNDLEAPAIGLTPLIGKALEVAASVPTALMARVTGSGATVFALFETAAAARQAAAACQRPIPAGGSSPAGSAKAPLRREMASPARERRTPMRDYPFTKSGYPAVRNGRPH